jgi:ParB/RepB/Spo0J family partition protein
MNAPTATEALAVGATASAAGTGIINQSGEAGQLLDIPLAHLYPSPTNPRKRFDQRALGELADSIKSHGVIQPIVVRANPNPKFPDAKYEIVAGERRFRASGIAEQGSILAMVRDLTDIEVLLIQVIENNQREDVHPLEEALGYKSLMQAPHNYTAQDIADKVGCSRRHVFNRLQLLELNDAAREAFLDQQVEQTVALYLARVPTQLQADALEALIDHGAELTARDAQKLLQEEFMLHLGEAPFDIKSTHYFAPGNTTTLSGARLTSPACGACPKRTGANPDLFADVESKDMCTDPQCYDAKRIAHNEITINAARKKMTRIIEGDEAKKLLPHQYFDRGTPTAYFRLDTPIGTLQRKFGSAVTVNTEADDKKTIAEILGKSAARETALFVNPHTGNAYEIIPDTAVAAAFKKAGLITEQNDDADTGETTGTTSSKSKAQAEAKKREAEQAQREQDRAIRRATFDAVRKKMHAAIDTCGGIPTLDDVRAIALALCQDYSIANALLELELCKPLLNEEQQIAALDAPDIMRIHIAQIDAPALFKLMFDATLCDSLNQTYWGNNPDDAPDPLAAAAKRHNIA